MSIESIVDHLTVETQEVMDGDPAIAFPVEGSPEEDALIEELRVFFTALCERHRRK
jgi:hypothetical protein